MTNYKGAIAYFTDVICKTDEIIADCTPALQNDLLEQKHYFVEALGAMSKVLECERVKEQGKLVWLPYTPGEVAYQPIDDFDDHYVSGDCRFGELCVQLMHKGKVEEIVPLSYIGQEIFVSAAAAQRKLEGCV